MALDNRTPNWSCIVYEDSLSKDYLAKLEETCVEICISPWHDMDRWTASDEQENPEHKEGELKKKHKHVVIMYGKGNKKSIEQVKEDFGFLNGTNFKKVKSVSGMIQYLDHRFCKTKHHYDERDIVSLNGFDYDEVVNLPSDKQTRIVLREMRVFCRDNEIFDFCDLQDLIDDDDSLVTWSKVLDSNQSKIVQYITSRRCKKKDEEKKNLSLRQIQEKAMQEGYEEPK